MDAAEIRLFEDARFSPDPSFVVEPSDVEKLAISIRLNLNQKLIFETVKKGDFVLAVTAVQPFLKKTRVVGTFPMDEDIPGEIAIGDEVLADATGTEKFPCEDDTWITAEAVLALGITR